MPSTQIEKVQHSKHAPRRVRRPDDALTRHHCRRYSMTKSSQASIPRHTMKRVVRRKALYEKLSAFRIPTPKALMEEARYNSPVSGAEARERNIRCLICLVEHRRTVRLTKEGYPVLLLQASSPVVPVYLCPSATLIKSFLKTHRARLVQSLPLSAIAAKSRLMTSLHRMFPSSASIPVWSLKRPSRSDFSFWTKMSTNN